MRTPHSLVLPAIAATLLLVASACGGDSGPELSARGEVGRKVALERGCAACHGNDGQGGAGPAWKGLAGSTVELEDGSTVVADDAYLRKSITDPGIQRTAGFTLQMPTTDLTDDEIDAVIAYIHDLSPESAGES